MKSMQSGENLKVIALVGMPGSGKGTCTDHLEAQYDLPIIHFGNMVYAEVQRRGLDNVEDEKVVREDMRKQEGPAVMAKHALQQAKDTSKPIVVFDGLYSWSEYRYLEGELGEHLITVAVAASKDVRRQRVLNRKDAHRKYTMEQLVNREIAEIEGLEKGGPIAYADYTIVNEGTTEELVAKLENLLRVKKLI